MRWKKKRREDNDSFNNHSNQKQILNMLYRINDLICMLISIPDNLV